MRKQERKCVKFGMRLLTVLRTYVMRFVFRITSNYCDERIENRIGWWNWYCLHQIGIEIIMKMVHTISQHKIGERSTNEANNIIFRVITWPIQHLYKRSAGFFFSIFPLSFFYLPMSSFSISYHRDHRNNVLQLVFPINASCHLFARYLAYVQSKF